MKCDILINLLGEYNAHNVIAIMQLKPERVIFLSGRSELENDVFDNLRVMIREKGYSGKITREVYTVGKLESINNIINKYRTNNTVINLSEGGRLPKLLARQAGIKQDIKCIYIDLSTQSMLLLQNNGEVEMLASDLPDITVNDIIDMAGGEIITQASDIYGKDIYLEYTDFLVKNYDMWCQVRVILKDKKRIRHNYNYPYNIMINLNKINKEVMDSLSEFAKSLKKYRLATQYFLVGNQIEVRFANREAKNFVCIIGNWLEVLTYKVVKELREIDDVQSGVRFLWDEDTPLVENELDVIAASQSILACISCKDTEKYDTPELNELEIYSRKIGGDMAKKILVATAEPENRIVMDRAKEMGISLIIFDGNVDTFKRGLDRVI